MNNKNIENYLLGDNAKINDVYFHVLDDNGERVPTSAQTLNKQAPTYFVIHGYRAGEGDEWLSGVDDFDNASGWKIEPDDFKQWENLDSTQHSLGLSIKSYDPTANVVLVDWGNFSFDVDFSLSPLYLRQANEGTDNAAEAINTYIKQTSISPDKITLVGHSLGGHTAGKAGKLSGGQISKIIAMDPAGPGFERYDRDARLSFNDAKDVYALHTSELFGYDGPLAMYDLYINATVGKSLLGGLDNDYSFPDIGAFNDVSKHSAANHITALMFAESAASQDKTSESFLASHLYNSQISDRFYGGALSSWHKALEIMRQSKDPFTGLKLNINNLFSNEYFSDQYFEWDFESSAPFSDEVGFWYDYDYPNRWNNGYQEDSVVLSGSPDTHATTSTTPTWLAWWGPIDGGVVWFDERNKKGQLNFFPDSDETQSFVNNGKFSIEIATDQHNNFTDTSYPVFFGLDDNFNEIRIEDPRQHIDFRDGLVMLQGTNENPMVDIMTGLDYEIPLVGLPGKKLNVMSTFKHLPVARWRNDQQFPETQASYRYTPYFIDSSTADFFRGIPDKFFDDNFNIYEFFSGDSERETNFGLDALAYEYAFLSLVKTTHELLDYLGIDKNGWMDYVDAKNTPKEVLTIYSMASAFSYIYSDLPVENDFNFNFSFKNDKGFSPFSKADVVGLWDTILRTSPTFLGNEEGSLFENNVPVSADKVDNLIQTIPLDRIAQSYIKRTREIDKIIHNAYEVGGKELIVPATAGSKGIFLEDGSESLIQNSISDAFTINKNKDYSRLQSRKLKNNIYYSNYENLASSSQRMISIDVDDAELIDAAYALSRGQKGHVNIEVNLKSPAPIYGLSVDYLLGGSARLHKDYKIKDVNEATINFQPDTLSQKIKVELLPDFLYNESTFQLQLLSSTSGFAVDDYKGSVQISALEDALSTTSAFTMYRNRKSIISGTNKDDLISTPKSKTSQNILMIGEDGADKFSLSPKSRGVAFIKDFNPYEGDKIILNSNEFSDNDLSIENISFFGGKFIYHDESNSASKVIALVGDGIGDTDLLLSSLPMKKHKYIEIVSDIV